MVVTAFSLEAVSGEKYVRAPQDTGRKGGCKSNVSRNSKVEEMMVQGSESCPMD